MKPMNTVCSPVLFHSAGRKVVEGNTVLVRLVWPGTLGWQRHLPPRIRDVNESHTLKVVSACMKYAMNKNYHVEPWRTRDQ